MSFDKMACKCGARQSDVAKGVHFGYDCATKMVEELREIAMKSKMPIIITGQRWSPKQGDNLIRFLPDRVPGGEAMQYEPQITVKILKNRNSELKFPEKAIIPPEISTIGEYPATTGEYSSQFPGTTGTEVQSFDEIDVVGNNRVAAAELEELCRDHDEAVEWDAEAKMFYSEEKGVSLDGQNWVKKYTLTVADEGQHEHEDCFWCALGEPNSIEEKQAEPPQEHKWGDRGITFGEAVTPDMAANAAMLREQLRVETNVRLALSERQDTQKPFFPEEPKRYTMKDIGTHVNRIVHLEYYENLLLLEKDTADMTDVSTGLSRFKIP